MSIASYRNDFLSAVSLESNAPGDTLEVKPLQPGTTAIPADIVKVVVRMGNPGAALNESVRSDNEVAAIQLSRDACSMLLRGILDRSSIPLLGSMGL